MRADRLEASPLQRERQQIDQLAIVVNQQVRVHLGGLRQARRCRKREPDPRAAARLAVDADAAAVRFDDALGDGQPESDARRVLSFRTR